MQVKVLFFGQLREIVGHAEQILELTDGASINDLMAHYRRLYPRLENFLSSLAIFHNQEYIHTSAQLQPGDEVALLPPVSGGDEEDIFELTHEPIHTKQFLGQLKAQADGALVTFVGTVRKRSHGRQTCYLEYEAYEPVARKKLYELGTEIRARFPINRMVLVHRLGRVGVGETCVFIAVAAAHRAPAFDACRYAIEYLKHSLPIWKKEYFVDGAVWAEGEVLASSEPAPTGQKS